MNRFLPVFPLAAAFLFFSSRLYAETAYTDAKNRLRLYDGGEAQTAYSRGSSGLTSRVIADGERYVQKNYDEYMRVVKEIIFYVPDMKKKAAPAKRPAAAKNAEPAKSEAPAEGEKTAENAYGSEAKLSSDGAGQTAAENPVVQGEIPAEVPDSKGAPEQKKSELPAYALLSEPTAVIDYFYEGRNSRAERIVETDFINRRRIETVYSPENLRIKESVYELSGGSEKEKILSQSEWTYDGENRLKQKKTVEGKHTASTVYVWTGGHLKPDERFYENGTLVMENTYAADGTKSAETLYFPDGLSVKTGYKDGKRVTETVMDGERLLREKKFENPD